MALQVKKWRGVPSEKQQGRVVHSTVLPTADTAGVSRLGHRPDNVGHTTEKGNCTAPKPGRAGDVRAFDEQTPTTTTFDPLLTFLSTSIPYTSIYRQLLMSHQQHNGLKSCNGRGGACAVKVRAVVVLTSPIYNDTGLYPHLFFPRSRKGYQSHSKIINPKLTPALLSLVLFTSVLVRDRRCLTGIPQAPLGGPAHLRPPECPADDRRPGALPLRFEEQRHRRRSREGAT